jgi:hypothetical protein
MPDHSVTEDESGMFSKVMSHETSPEAAKQIQQQGFKKSRTGIFFNVEDQNYSGGGYGGAIVMAKVSGPIDDILNLEDDNDLPDDLDDFADGEEIADYARSEGYWAWTDGVQFAVLDPRHIQVVKQGVAEAAKKCPPATQDITINLNNRQKAINEYGYGPLNPDLPNNKFWMKKVNEWNLDSMEEAQSSLCGNCAAFDIRQETLDCIAQGIDSDSPADAEGVIDAGDLGYCKFLKFKCASRRTCDAWVTGGPLADKPVDENQGWAATYETNSQNFVGGMKAGYQARENQPVAEQDQDYIEEKWSEKYKSSINCASPKGFSQRAHCAGRKK